MRKILVLATTLLIFSNSFAIFGNRKQGYSKKDVGKILKAIDTIRVDDFGAKGDGVTDDTAAIRAAVEDIRDEGGTIYFSNNKTYMVDSNTTITLRSNVNIYIPENCIVKALPNDQGGYEVFKGENISNFKIYGGGTIAGERDEHTGSTGEWGFGIQLNGVNDYTISDIRITDCWGDGIYLGSSTTQVYCENGLIENVDSYDNRRQGASIISAKNLLIRNCIFRDTNGVAPESGIDFEPNNDLEFLENIILENVVTRNNLGQGFEFYFRNLDDATSADVDIKMINCKDVGSENSFYVRSTPAMSSIDMAVDNFISEDSTQTSVLITDTSYLNEIKLNNLTVKGGNTSSSVGDTTGSGIVVIRNSDLEPTVEVGGVYINDFSVVSTNYNWSVLVKDLNSQAGYKNVKLVNPKVLENSNELNTINWHYNGESHLQDDYGITTETLTATETIYPTRHHLVYETSVNTTATLSNYGDYPANYKATFKNPALGTTLIIDTGNMRIFPLQTTAGNTITCSERGGQITLVKKGNDLFITNVIGTWTAQ